MFLDPPGCDPLDLVQLVLADARPAQLVPQLADRAHHLVAERRQLLGEPDPDTDPESEEQQHRQQERHCRGRGPGRYRRRWTVTGRTNAVSRSAASTGTTTSHSRAITRKTT